MKVKELMHKGIESSSLDTSVAVLAKKMQQYDIGAIPIMKNGQLVGMVTDRDITVRALADGKDVAKLSAQDVMTKGVIFCRDTEDVEDAVRVMESKQIRRLPVLDEHKKMVGMLSIGDISHTMPRDMTAEVMKSVSAHHA